MQTVAIKNARTGAEVSFPNIKTVTAAKLLESNNTNYTSKTVNRYTIYEVSEDDFEYALDIMQNQQMIGQDLQRMV